MLRVKVFTFGDLDSLSVWFSLMVEKEGDLGRKEGLEGGSKLWGKVAVWQGG